MQYLLTEEEYDDLESKQDHLNIRKNLLERIDKLNERVMALSNRHCIHDLSKKESILYCDNCPLGAFGTKTCTKRQQEYSK